MIGRFIKRLTRLVIFTLCFCMAYPPVAAQDSALETLDTWGRNRGWEGVGLLTINGKTSCTGAMIQADLVLTAAHCLYDKAGKKVDPRQVEFRAGWRDGKAVASRHGITGIVHPNYDPNADLSDAQIRYDVGLLKLSAPILPTHADPFLSGRGIGAGQEVSVVSYGKGRNDAASRQRSCNVLDEDQGVVAMTCDVVPGSSGAPVFGMRDGRPEIVAVVSALGRVNGKQISFAMDVANPLSRLLKDFRAGTGVFPIAAVPSARRLTVGSKRSSGGARFIRP